MERMLVRLVVLVVALVAIGVAHAGTFVVTDSSDGVELPFGCTTLRQAIAAANASPGADTISFDLSDGQCGVQGPGPYLISLTRGPLAITDAVTIDGYTQSGASANTLDVGSNAALMIAVQSNAGDVFDVAAPSELRGLAIASGDSSATAVGFEAGSDGSTLAGSFVGVGPDGQIDNFMTNNGGDGVTASAAVTIGGTAPADRNVISGSSGRGKSGIVLNASGSTIAGNLIGTDPAGSAATGFGNTEGVQSNGWLADGAPETVVGPGNVISGNSDAGIFPSFQRDTSGNELVTNHMTIVGNLIGLDAAGTSALGNNDGIYVDGGDTDIVIGGTDASARNVISGNGDRGIADFGGATQILGNYVGLNATGDAAIGNDTGIDAGNGAVVGGNVVSGNATDGIFDNGTGVTIDGNVVGLGADASTPVGNGGNGITLDRASGTTVTGNVVSSNGGAGISLGGSSGNAIGSTAAGDGNVVASNGSDGVVVQPGFFGAPSANDSIRGNSIDDNGGLGIHLVGGSNDAATAPALSAAVDGSALHVTGSLDSFANETFQIDFYSSPACDPGGSGEGRTYLRSQTVATDGAGHAAIDDAALPSVDAGQVITATATDASADTSQFSSCVTVTAAPSGGGGSGGGGGGGGGGVVAGGGGGGPTVAANPVAASFDLALAQAPLVFHLDEAGNLVAVVTNNGPDAASGVQLTETFSGPAGTPPLEVGSVSSSVGTCGGTGPVTCSIGTLAGGASATVTISLRSSATGAFTATGTIAPGTDSNPANDSATSPIGVALRLQAPPPAPPSAPILPASVRGSLINAQPVSGIVLVDGVPFLSPAQLRPGAVIDTRGGSIELITGNDIAIFSGGIFRLVQPRDPRAPTDLVLQGGASRTVCGTAKKAKKPKNARGPAAVARPKVLNLLFGNGKGNFRTRGRYSAATVRGTIWLVADRCDGTFTSVRNGSVSVLDQVRRKTIVVTAGHSYLAKPK